jgi:hypothetical protein
MCPSCMRVSGCSFKPIQAPHKIRRFIAAHTASNRFCTQTPRLKYERDIRKSDISTLLSCHIALSLFLDEQSSISSASEGEHSLVEHNLPSLLSESFFPVVNTPDILSH